MNGPELLLHVVGSEEVQRRGKLEQQVVLKAKHGGGSDQGGLGENASGDLLCTSLQQLLAQVASKISVMAYLGGVEFGF